MFGIRISKFARVFTSALFLVSQVGLPGCGNGPLNPTTKSSPLSAERRPRDRVARMPSDDAPPDNGAPAFAPANWHGGKGSLPLGPDITPQELLAHVDSLPAVVAAKAAFASRGYIRRQELDSLKILPGYSMVLLGYQKPGLELNQAEAYIFVSTRRLDLYVDAEVCGGPTYTDCTHESVPATLFQTQVGGGLIEHTASDSILFVDTPADPAITISGTITGTPAPSATFGNERVTLTGLRNAIDAVDDWCSSMDIFGYGSPPDVTWTCAPIHSPEYYAELAAIAQENAYELEEYGDEFMIGFTSGLVIGLAAPAAFGTVTGLTIRMALIDGMGGGLTFVWHKYWTDHR